VHVEAFPGEAADDETYGALIRADRANSVRFTADFPADEDNLTVEYVVLTLLNVYDGPPLPGPTLSAAEMAVEGGEVKPIAIDFAREEWGADESLRFRGRGPHEIWPRAYVSTKKVVVHHTGTANDYDEEDAKADVRAIYTYHARTLGWGDIGYNSLVDRFGKSYEGRYGRDGPDGREILSEDVVAGHALAHNYGSTGVALLGTFCLTDDECTGGTTPSDEMILRLTDILVWESRQHGIDPHGVSDFLLSTDAWNRELDNICGHLDCTSTICPGGFVYALLPELRRDVAARLDYTSAPTVTITAPEPPEDTVDDGDASYTWEGAGGSGALFYSHYLEGWFKPSNSDDINYLSGYNENKEPQWSDWTNATTTSFDGLEDGHYTFHIRAKDKDGNISVYEDNRTFLANLSAPSPCHGPGCPR